MAALRVGLCVILLWRLLVGPFGTLAHQPAGLYRPVSFMHAFQHMPSPMMTKVLLALAIGATLLALLGAYSRVFLPVAYVCALVLFGMTTSTGKIMHNDVSLLLALFPLALGTTDAVWSVRRRCNERITGTVWPVRVALLVVVAAYFFSGLAKLTHSGPSWAFSENLRWILYANSDGRAEPNAWALFVADHAWLAVLGSIGILATELLFPLVLWRHRLVAVLLPAAVLFHVGTRLTLGLDYSAWIAVDVVVLTTWVGFAPWHASHLASQQSKSP